MAVVHILEILAESIWVTFPSGFGDVAPLYFHTAYAGLKMSEDSLLFLPSGILFLFACMPTQFLIF